MRLKMRSSVVAVLMCLPALAHADQFSFALKKGATTFGCSPGTRSNTSPIQVSVRVPKEVAADTVKLEVVVDLVSGNPLKGALVRGKDAEGNNWAFSPETTETKAKKVTISGMVDNLKVDCPPFEPPTKEEEEQSPRQSGGTFTQEDFAAAQWLEDHDVNLATIRLRIKAANPKWPEDRIILLPHLPSGAKAPSYPASVSERDLTQVVMVVPKGTGEFLGTGASLTWSLTRCESIPHYRVQGDFASLVPAQAKVAPKREYELIRVGHVMSCGAEALTYSLLVSSGGETSREPVVSTVPVRPVYHIGATAMFGFDATKQSTFLNRGGKIDDVVDRVGPGLLVGGTYFIKGVDYGDMRWYNHVTNPFVVVSLASPKDRFVVGTALTYRGGISLGLGAAFNHVPVLATGFSAGQDFTGEGDIPQDKTWTKGFYIGIGVDDKLFASLSKLKKAGTGGGTKDGSAAQAAAKEKQD